MNLKQFLLNSKKRVDKVLIKKLPNKHCLPHHLHQAMAYSVLGNGKRLRAAFIFALGKELGAKSSVLNDIAAAIEILHAASLVHDDLPSFDNDQLRRGKDTCHKVFGEATAILTGDALFNLSYKILCDIPDKYLPSLTKVKMINCLAQAAGSFGLSGGEELDIEMSTRPVSVKQLEKMYQLKTSSLLNISMTLAALAANCHNKKTLNYITQFSLNLGLAYQIHDDIIGIESNTKTLGKQQGSDMLNKKINYPVLVSLDRAKKREKFLYKKALDYINKLDINTELLQSLTEYTIHRKY